MIEGAGDARTVRGAVIRGFLRLVVLLALALVAVVFSRGEPLGNRNFLWGVAGLLAVVAVWGLVETWREVGRVRRRG